MFWWLAMSALWAWAAFESFAFRVSAEQPALLRSLLTRATTRATALDAGAEVLGAEEGGVEAEGVEVDGAELDGLGVVGFVGVGAWGVAGFAGADAVGAADLCEADALCHFLCHVLCPACAFFALCVSGADGAVAAGALGACVVGVADDEVRSWLCHCPRWAASSQSPWLSATSCHRPAEPTVRVPWSSQHAMAAVGTASAPSARAATVICRCRVFLRCFLIRASLGGRGASLVGSARHERCA
ncbi:hypothetical protein GCM10023335_22670 [Streptomyces siamensis]|uniref:Secreted protein n=1 Tax=Streptomyces siamensis TaxID=1274986 RepID=A0ABP9IR49_9ACTN